MQQTTRSSKTTTPQQTRRPLSPSNKPKTKTTDHTTKPEDVLVVERPCEHRAATRTPQSTARTAQGRQAYPQPPSAAGPKHTGNQQNSIKPAAQGADCPTAVTAHSSRKAAIRTLTPTTEPRSAAAPSHAALSAPAPAAPPWVDPEPLASNPDTPPQGTGLGALTARPQ